MNRRAGEGMGTDEREARIKDEEETRPYVSVNFNRATEHVAVFTVLFYSRLDDLVKGG